MPTATTKPDGEPAARRAVRLEYATIGWNTLEAIVAIVSGALAASVALMAFGIDSAIEIVSAAVVAVRLRALLAGIERDERRQRRALLLVAGCFFALAAYIIIDASLTLARGDHPATSVAGTAIAAAALVVMPLLAIGKRRAGGRLANAGLRGPALLVRADGTETLLCAVLAASTLVGLVLNATMKWWWADPLSSLTIVYFAIREGLEAWPGDRNDEHP